MALRSKHIRLHQVGYLLMRYLDFDTDGLEDDILLAVLLLCVHEVK